MKHVTSGKRIMMGFRTTENIKAVCPLYEQVVIGAKGKIVGIQCESFIDDHSLITRYRNTEEMLAAKKLLCDSHYTSCPYYQMYESMR